MPKLHRHGASFEVQLLGLPASTAGGAGSIPGGELRSHMLCDMAKKFKKTQNNNK